ncbi:MAG: hypothetical protein ACI87I_001960 [Pseudoalteromonas tetraodonis]|jgi:hypothetical protein
MFMLIQFFRSISVCLSCKVKLADADPPVLPRGNLHFVAHTNVSTGREQDAEALLDLYLPTRLQTSWRD